MEKIKGKYVFTEEELQDIIQSYLNVESSTSIGKRYGVCHKVILKILHENNICIDQKKFVRKYNLNENYFDEINTPNKAYILGFFFADGSVNKNKGTISMSLQEEDKNILNEIRKEIESEKPLEYLDYSNKHDYGYNYKNQYRLLMFSTHMCESLEKIGMVQNKSLILEFPNIQEELYSHFIRGYFDGDGSYCSHFTKNGKFQPLITITSTNDFCNSVRNIIQDKLNIPCGNIYDASCKNGVTKVLSFSGRKQVKKFLDWIYCDSTMRLDRKYNKYIDTYNYLNNSLIA